MRAKGLLCALMQNTCYGASVENAKVGGDEAVPEGRANERAIKVGTNSARVSPQ